MLRFCQPKLGNFRGEKKKTTVLYYDTKDEHTCSDSLTADASSYDTFYNSKSDSDDNGLNDSGFSLSSSSSLTSNESVRESTRHRNKAGRVGRKTASLRIVDDTESSSEEEEEEGHRNKGEGEGEGKGKRGGLRAMLSKTNVKKKSSSLRDSTPQNDLPGTWYYSSNHILVNQERVLRSLKPLRRCRDLDDQARAHATNMATKAELQHSVHTLEELRTRLGAQQVGENIQRGKSIRQMHAITMADERLSSRANMLSSKFADFGMGTHKSQLDGSLYMVQLFRGPSDTTTTITSASAAHPGIQRQ